ncbi:class I SAM-dependent methyltransferase [Leucothrix pacifica]|uniref:Class I SAM-dependent methyltransferase n=1 Tax=Leucothrix pacifica TaxID=1247513 RepID=A0A317CNK9_9GAMM|nr:class I SAM-dependent methyltransferase [Leucothrix pacifica]PWR00216.1 class I SAM-dependent methyltransferase [Leucothrix pacifica]
MSNKSDIYYSGTRSNMAAFLPDSYSRVLEVGCGDGAFRSNLEEDCEYWGVEPFTPSYETASKVLDKVVHGTYEEVADSLPNDYFDLVICNDVIEHMVDHDKFFSDIKSKMKKDSYIVGSIPNVRFFPNLLSLIFDKDWEYQDEGVLDRTHLRFFTEKSIIQTFARHDFIINKFEGINSISFKPSSLKKIAKIITIKALGKDTLHLQFGFCVKYSTNK